MARRALFTILAVVLAGAAFDGADPAPDINLFGVLFLAVAYLVWFHWHEIEAGYAYLDDDAARPPASGLMLIRFAPMHLRELARRTRRNG
jgi:hypothetical protein